MANIDLKLSRQSAILNLMVVALVVSVVFTPGWHSVAALACVLGALGFQWTVAGQVPPDQKRMDAIEKSVTEVGARIGLLATKVGLKGG